MGARVWYTVPSQAIRKEREGHGKILGRGCFQVGFWLTRKNELNKSREGQRQIVDPL